jgi:hypothetical protein
LPLTAATARIAAEHVRGGNGGRGPFAKSGGGPALLLAAFDLVPQPARKLSGTGAVVEYGPSATKAETEATHNTAAQRRK